MFAGIAAFGVAIYSGFVVGYVGAIKLWNSAIIPILFVVAGLTGGMAILLLASQGESSSQVIDVATAMVVVLVVYAVSIAVYLWITTYESHVARDSVMLLLKGSIAPVFWIGVIACGIISPLVISVSSYFSGDASTPLLIMAIVFHIIGAIALKYMLLKAGIHNPILPVKTSTYY